MGASRFMYTCTLQVQNGNGHVANRKPVHNKEDATVEVNDSDYSWVDKLGVWPRRILLVLAALT